MSTTFDAVERGELKHSTSQASNPSQASASSLNGDGETCPYNGRGSSSSYSSGMAFFRSHMNENLDPRCTIFVLITCFFASGLIDSVAFNSWNCFVSMQTGNTIFAALGLSGQPFRSHRHAYFKSLTSVGAFCLGTLFFSFLHRYPRLSQQPQGRRRSVFLISFLIQALFILIVAILVNQGIVSDRAAVIGTFSSGSHRYYSVGIVEADLTRTNYADLAGVAILAFQAAGQVALSRVLLINELATIVLSATYFDFFGDLYSLRSSWRASQGEWKQFLLGNEKKQMKRFGSIVALFLGGIVGGEMFKSRVGMGGALWLAAALKGCICVVWILWRADDDADDPEADSLGASKALPK